MPDLFFRELFSITFTNDVLSNSDVYAPQEGNQTKYVSTVTAWPIGQYFVTSRRTLPLAKLELPAIFNLFCWKIFWALLSSHLCRPEDPFRSPEEGAARGWTLIGLDWKKGELQNPIPFRVFPSRMGSSGHSKDLTFSR